MSKQSIDASLIYHPPSYPRCEQKEIERAYTRLFLSEDGKKVLAHMQTMTFHRALDASSSDAQLLYLEGQRAMMAMVMRLIDRGRS